MSTAASLKPKVAKANPATPSIPASVGLLLQRKCACGTPTASLTGRCNDCLKTPMQAKLTVGASNDPLEHEADRVADQVMATPSGPAARPVAPLGSPAAGARVQREEAPKEQTDEEKYTEGIGKLGEAFLETPFGKELLARLKKSDPARAATEFVSTWQGKVVTGGLAASTVAALAATHTELPLQIPELPLDFLIPGLAVKITYRGPVDKPTEAMISFKFSEQRPRGSGDKKSAPTATDEYRAETARLAEADRRFRAGLRYPPGSPEDLQQRAEQAPTVGARPPWAFDLDAYSKKYPGLAPPQPRSGLQLEPPELRFGRKPLRLLDQRLELRRPGDPKEKADEEPVLQRKPVDSAAAGTGGQGSLDHVDAVLGSPGRPLEAETREFMEGRFGRDFSRVRIHSGAAAERSAQEVGAKAYTVGQSVVFGAGQYAPGTTTGRRLLAHELAHVVQQSNPAVRQPEPGDARRGWTPSSAVRNQGEVSLQRCVDPKKNDPRYDSLAHAVKATPAYRGLGDKTVADGIIVDAKQKGACLYYVGALWHLFQTTEDTPAAISTRTKAATVQEAAKEQVRIAKPAEAKNLTVEEVASADPARIWVRIKGKFGGGTYQVDRSNPKNIVVKAKVFLTPAGTGTAVDVRSIQQMEDAIEKAASMKGLSVDIAFVATPDADTFTAKVDPSKWEDAENWSGGEPKGFAHELFHMFAYELDRYDYIEAHATNASMKISDRLHWFAVQLTKPGGFDNPRSLMGSGAHPLDDDACKVAGLDPVSCVAARRSPAKP